MKLRDIIKTKLESEEIYSETTVIIQTESGEDICALPASDLLDSDSDCLSMDVSSTDFDDDENLVVVVE